MGRSGGIKPKKQKDVPPELAEAILRVARMEEILDELLQFVAEKPENSLSAKALRKQRKNLDPKVKELESYYSGPVWKEDFARDERGEFPPDLKRGVLSEDAVYDALSMWDEQTGPIG